MNSSIDVGQPRPRLISQGRAFVYVLPCVFEDILKVGFSRDPVARLQTLHRRYFEFFDLESALLIETDNVRDARRIERRLLDALRDHRAPAPRIVPFEAAGHTEWFRGTADKLIDLANCLALEQGYRVHAPLCPWIRSELAQRADLLFEWSSHAWLQLECLTEAEDRRRATAALRDALDAYAALDLTLIERIPGEVFNWYHAQRSG
jgi:hypothetical protein